MGILSPGYESFAKAKDKFKLLKLGKKKNANRLMALRLSAVAAIISVPSGTKLLFRHQMWLEYFWLSSAQASDNVLCVILNNVDLK